MKSAVIYYSYSGNTRKVAEALAEYLGAELINVEALDEPASFAAQARRAFFKVRAKIKPVKFDLSGYGLVCFGTPVWAFAPSPAMNTYLDNCFGLEGKKAIAFTTYCSGAGNRHCLNYMLKLLHKKGARKLDKFTVQQEKAADTGFVISLIEGLTRSP
jgi:flavodoxin